MTGKITKRDPETGRILAKELSSEEAKAMQAKQHVKTKAAKKNDVEILLNEAGYPDLDTAPKALQILCREIAEGGARTISAIVEYRRSTAPPDSSEQTLAGKPRPGSICPTCNELVMTDFRPDAELVEQAADYLGYGHKRHYGVKQQTDGEDREQPTETGNPFKGNGE